MLLTAYLELWLSTYVEPKKARSTANGYRQALAHLDEAARQTELRALDPITLQQEINRLAEEYPRQAQILHVSLHAALKKAVKLRMLDANPMDLVEKPNHESREAAILDPEEAAAYLREAQNLPAGKLLVLMACLGLRRNEARGLYPDDLDGDGVLHIRRQRTRNGPAPLKSRSSRRNLPLPVPLRAIFTGTPGQYLVDVSEKSLRTQHRKALSRAGIEKNVTLHGLRHTCATLAILDGCSLVDVQKLLGHRHYTLTADLYTHAQALALARCTDLIYNTFFAHQMEKGARLEIV